MKNITIGIAGHVDHGKTSLVRCLTGIDTDRKPEEKRRGLSIESGVALLKLLPDAQIALIDVPGHVDFMKNTIRGLNSVDAAVLVVAANDGLMPQTREHLEILKFFNASDGFIVISKVDLVDDEILELAELEIHDIIKDTFLDGKPVIPFSALDGRGVKEILDAVRQIVKNMGRRKNSKPFHLWIDQKRTFKGFGTVVSGTVVSGILKPDDNVRLLPMGIETRVRSIEAHGEKVSTAVAGQRIGVNLHKVSALDVERGMALSEPGAVEPTYIYNADFHLLKSARKPIKNRQRIKVYLGTSITNALVVMIGKEHLSPGESGIAQFRLMKPVAVRPKDRFIISLLNQNSVIGGGQVLEMPRQRFRNAIAPLMVPYLEALQQEDLPGFISHYLRYKSDSPVSGDELAKMTGVERKYFESEISRRVHRGEFVYFKGRGAMDIKNYQTIRTGIQETIQSTFQKDQLKRNISINELSSRFDRIHPDFLKTIVHQLCAEKELVQMDGGFQLPDSMKQFTADREQLIAQLLDYAAYQGTTPFSADTFWKHYNQTIEKGEIQQTLNFLSSQKKLIRLEDNRFLCLEALEEIKSRVKMAIQDKGKIKLTDSKDILGYGRWGGAPVFDYLDRIGFTARIGNERILKG